MDFQLRDATSAAVDTTYRRYARRLDNAKSDPMTERQRYARQLTTMFPRSNDVTYFSGFAYTCSRPVKAGYSLR